MRLKFSDFLLAVPVWFLKFRLVFRTAGPRRIALGTETPGVRLGDFAVILVEEADAVNLLNGEARKPGPVLDYVVKPGLGAELHPDFHRLLPAEIRAGEHGVDSRQALHRAGNRVLQAVEDGGRRQLPVPARARCVGRIVVKRVVVPDRPGEAARRIGVDLGIERRRDPAHRLADAGAKLSDIRFGNPAVRHGRLLRALIGPALYRTRQASASRAAFQSRPVLRVGNRDHRAGPLLQGPPGEFRNPVLGDDRIGVRARRRDRPRQAGHDPGMPPSGGGQGDDAPASGAVQGRALEIPLPADGADITPVQGLGVHLPCQIDLNGGVDGEKALQAREHTRAVDMVGPSHSEDGIAVRIAVKPGRAEQETGRDEAGIGLPVAVSDGAALR